MGDLQVEEGDAVKTDKPGQAPATAVTGAESYNWMFSCIFKFSKSNPKNVNLNFFDR